MNAKLKRNIKKSLKDRNLEDLLWNLLSLSTEEVLSNNEDRTFKVGDVHQFIHNIIQIEKTTVKAKELDYQQDMDELKEWAAKPVASKEKTL